jgi:hypothetical protein
MRAMNDIVWQTPAAEVRIDRPNFTKWNERVPFRTAEEDETHEGDDTQWSEIRGEYLDEL